MNAILESLGMTADDVSRLCEKYGRRVEPARPREVDFTGTDSSTEGGVR